jgi:hypothetical protein
MANEELVLSRALDWPEFGDAYATIQCMTGSNFPWSGMINSILDKIIGKSLAWMDSHCFSEKHVFPKGRKTSVQSS